MKTIVQNIDDISDVKISISKNLTEKYQSNPNYSEKLKWAKEYLKNRDLNKELAELKKRERITRP